MLSEKSKKKANEQDSLSVLQKRSLAVCIHALWGNVLIHTHTHTTHAELNHLSVSLTDMTVNESGELFSGNLFFLLSL